MTGCFCLDSDASACPCATECKRSTRRPESGTATSLAVKKSDVLRLLVAATDVDLLLKPSLLLLELLSLRGRAASTSSTPSSPLVGSDPPSGDRESDDGKSKTKPKTSSRIRGRCSLPPPASHDTSHEAARAAASEPGSASAVAISRRMAAASASTCSRTCQTTRRRARHPRKTRCTSHRIAHHSTLGFGQHEARAEGVQRARRFVRPPGFADQPPLSPARLLGGRRLSSPDAIGARVWRLVDRPTASTSACSHPEEIPRRTGKLTDGRTDGRREPSERHTVGLESEHEAEQHLNRGRVALRRLAASCVPVAHPSAACHACCPTAQHSPAVWSLCRSATGARLWPSMSPQRHRIPS
jgi:hypothetical protein